MLYTDSQLTITNLRNSKYSIEIIQVKGTESIKTLYTNLTNKTQSIKFGHEYALRILNLFPHSYVVSVTKVEKEGN